MNLMPPSGYRPDQADGTDPQWTRWWAWFPVTVDAYDNSEIRNGQFSYKVCFCWVESRLRPDQPPSDENDYSPAQPAMQYRLPRQ